MLNASTPTGDYLPRLIGARSTVPFALRDVYRHRAAFSDSSVLRPAAPRDRKRTASFANRSKTSSTPRSSLASEKSALGVATWESLLRRCASTVTVAYVSAIHSPASGRRARLRAEHVLASYTRHSINEMPPPRSETEPPTAIGSRVFLMLPIKQTFSRLRRGRIEPERAMSDS